ncbi:MAG: hypothetical protein IT457_16060 [Planctomycetes bacterium]|nr:hypothetical protein [Planctomycetota bacterium]
MQSSSLRAVAAGLLGLAFLAAPLSAQDTVFPPFGGTTGGSPFDIRAAAAQQPWKVLVHHNPQGSGGLMNGLQLLYCGRDMGSTNGQSNPIGSFSGQGYTVSELACAPGEYLNRVDVWVTAGRVTRIRLYTPTTSQTFGDNQIGDTRQNFFAPAGEQVIGFHGRASTNGSIYSLGVITRPILASEQWIGTGCTTSRGELQLRWRPTRENLIAGTIPIIEYTNIPNSATAMIVYGFTDVSWSGAPLPFDMGLIGSPGCFLYQSIDFVIFSSIEPGNLAGHGIDLRSVPPELIGGNLFFQGLMLSSSGVFKTSNGVKATIGRI